MNGSRGLMTFSFNLGSALGAQWRLSFLVPVLWLALLWRLQDVTLGLLAATIVLLSLILHELGHLIATAFTRGHAEEVILWPLGSLTQHTPGDGFRAVLATSLGGPIVSFVAAACCLLFMPDREMAVQLLNPFAQFQVAESESIRLTALRMCLMANWCLAVLNLLPLLPLDFGRVIHQFLTLRFTAVESRDLMLRSGLVLCVFGLFAGYVFDFSSLTALFAFLLILHMHESIQRQPQVPAQSAAEEETFLGYDFSEGYSSLARSAARYEEEDETWHKSQEFATSDDSDMRHEAVGDRLAQQRAEEDRLLDATLKKLHESGRDALNARELRILKRASDRFRERPATDA
jgi:Zn-dependent protease